MEISKDQDGLPVFHVFFKANPEAWYYFGFEDNRLMVQSSYDAFNEVIIKKSNARKVKVGEIAFIPGSEEETLAFINRFRKSYYGIDVPYSLYDSQEPVRDQAPPTIMPTIPTDEPPAEKPKKQRRQKKDKSADEDTEVEEQEVVPQPAPADQPVNEEQKTDEEAQPEEEKKPAEEEEEDDGF